MLSRFLSRIAGPSGAPPPLTQERAMRQIRKNGVAPATIIDVGAARGDWSRLARGVWPDAGLHLIEAKERWRPALEAFTRKTPNASFAIAGVIDAPGAAYFEEGPDEYGGAAYKAATDRPVSREIAATSIDHEVERLSLKGPFAIKLDTHGTEADILNGAAATLKHTAFLCIEAYNLIGQLHFSDLIVRLREDGFGCVDLADPGFRPRDGVLWQMDLFFLRLDHPIFADASYS